MSQYTLNYFANILLSLLLLLWRQLLSVSVIITSKRYSDISFSAHWLSVCLIYLTTPGNKHDTYAIIIYELLCN